MLDAGPATASPTPRLWTYSGAGRIESDDYALARLIQNRPNYCPAGKPIPASMTPAAALASARHVVVDLAGANAVSAFDHSATARSAEQSRAAAVGMFTGRKTAAALLALLRVHQLQPKDASNRRATAAPRPTACARARTKRAATKRAPAQPRARFTPASEMGTATALSTATRAQTKSASMRV